MVRNTGVIYCLKCPLTEKVRYIGQTIQDINLRLKQHLWYSSKCKNHLGYWLSSLTKNPIIEVLEECFYEELNSKELYWIDYYKNNKLVNSMVGCHISGHHIHSEESKRKIGEATKRIHTGMKRSEETKRKISEAAKKRIRKRKPKPIKINKQKVFLYIYDVEKKMHLKMFIKEFANYLNIWPNSIQDRLKRYSDKIYRNRYIISKSESELKVLLKQLGINE